MDHSEHLRIKLLNHYFRLYITQEKIRSRVAELGAQLNDRLGARERPPCYVVMLKGAFIFAADLIRASGFDGEVCFVRTRSYAGVESSGKVELLIAPERALVENRDVVLIEDIIDSGRTMRAFLPVLEELGARSITVVTLLHKPEAMVVDVPIDLIGFTVPTLFLVGYGLDYDGRGRNLPHLYQLDQSF